MTKKLSYEDAKTRVGKMAAKHGRPVDKHMGSLFAALMTKKLSYEEAKTRADKMTDILGCPIDKNIKPLVIALWMLGINTEASCEGHLNSGCPYPWIDIAQTSNQLAFFILMSSPGKKGSDKTKSWVFHPMGGGKYFRITPWDVKRPLEELQRDAISLAHYYRRLLSRILIRLQ